MCQLRFLQLVLKSTGQRSLFNKTKVVGGKRVALNSDELKANLEEVIRLNPGSTAFGDNEEASGRVRPRDERDIHFQTEKAKLYARLQEARRRRLILNQKEKLPELLLDPKKLVGKRIKHRVVEESEDDSFWCDGNVLEITEENNDTPAKTQYRIHYDIEPSKLTWTFPLLLDLKKGDLIVLSLFDMGFF